MSIKNQTFKANNISEELLNLAKSSKKWCFVEAQKLLDRQEKLGNLHSKTIIFETGYGPSGLPHIGTFGEVARTLMVRHAFHVLTENKVATKLLCFSDDMDALRKVPGNVPFQEELQKYIGMPLTKVPDPFALEEVGANGDRPLISFGERNNQRLCAFLDRFGFDYEFASSSQYYKSGIFDATLQKMLNHYEQIMAIMLPRLGQERQATYSIFLPISKHSGQVLQVPIEIVDKANHIIRYYDNTAQEWAEHSILGGQVKCQWKADWAMRWAALGIDYEMAGKDLIDSTALAGKICKAIDAIPPAGFNYELFLDENGQKISKSKGNGLTIDEWLNYAPESSLRLYMYQKPKTAKRLYFDVIPKAVDEYYSALQNYKNLTSSAELLENPLFYIHNGDDPNTHTIPISYAMLLNLVAATGSTDADVILGLIERYSSTDIRENESLVSLVNYALQYYKDYIAPNRKFVVPTESEVAVLLDIKENLMLLAKEYASAEELQNLLLSIARKYPEYCDANKLNAVGLPAVKGDFFKMLYKTLLGAESGPRFGSFIELYGIVPMIELIDKTIEHLI